MGLPQPPRMLQTVVDGESQSLDPVAPFSLAPPTLAWRSTLQKGGAGMKQRIPNATKCPRATGDLVIATECSMCCAVLSAMPRRGGNL